MMKEYDNIKKGRYIKKTKDFSKPCPECGAIMEFDIIKLRNLRPSKKTKYEIIYECPNNCSLRFEDIFQNVDTEEQIIWYEEEEDDDL